jgi:hypothetical protein
MSGRWRRSNGVRVLLQALVVGVLLAAAAAGAAKQRPLTVARYPSFLFSFSYPTAWKRLDCKQTPTAFTSPVGFLTTATPTPDCTRVGWPKQRLGKDGVFVAWWSYAIPGPQWDNITKFTGRDTRVDGQPARIAVTSARTSTSPIGDVNCTQVGAKRAVSVTVRRLGLPGQWMRMAACLRGPDFGAGEALIQQMLASVKFAKP